MFTTSQRIGLHEANDHSPLYEAWRARQQQFTGGTIVLKDPVKVSMPGPSNANASTEIYFDRERDSQDVLSAEVVEALFRQFLEKATNARGHYHIFASHIGGAGWTVTAVSLADSQKHEVNQ